MVLQREGFRFSASHQSASNLRGLDAPVAQPQSDLGDVTSCLQAIERAVYLLKCAGDSMFDKMQARLDCRQPHIARERRDISLGTSIGLAG